MKIAKMVLRFARDNDGAVLVEATIMMTIMFVLVLGSVDFLFAFYQWNAAAKAVQVGARIAAVSDPVARGSQRSQRGGRQFLVAARKRDAAVHNDLRWRHCHL